MHHQIRQLLIRFRDGFLSEIELNAMLYELEIYLCVTANLITDDGYEHLNGIDGELYIP